MLPIEGLRSQLLTRRRQLFHDVAKTEDDLLWLEVDPQAEGAEKGQEENMIRLLDRMDGRMKAEIEAIDQALVRIETGDYGRCEECGQEIGQARLVALPTAGTCLDCAKQQESRAVWGK